MQIRRPPGDRDVHFRGLVVTSIRRVCRRIWNVIGAVSAVLQLSDLLWQKFGPMMTAVCAALPLDLVRHLVPHFKS